MANDDVKLSAAATVDIIVAAGADHAVAMNEPCATELGVASRWKAIRKTNFGRVRIRIHQRREWHAPRAPFELGCDRALPGLDGFLAFRVRPLNDVVVLGAHDGGTVVITLTRERFDVSYVVRSELRGQVDDHPAAGQLEVERALGIQRTPVGRC